MSFDLEWLEEFGLTEGEKHFRRLIKAVENKESPPTETLKFLAGAGKKILAGDEPKKALLLEKPRGRKKKDEFRIFMEITIVQAICGLMDEHNFTKDQALDRLADLYSRITRITRITRIKGCSRSSLEHFYDEHKDLARKSNKIKEIETVVYGEPPSWVRITEAIRSLPTKTRPPKK